MLILKVAETWPVCTVCNGWVMLLAYWEVMMMYAQSFPFQCIFSATLPTFRKGVRCATALHPLTLAVLCAVHFSTLRVVSHEFQFTVFHCFPDFTN